MPFLSLIVPVYDEEDNLKALHKAIQEALVEHDFEVIYVNDGSKDGSAQVLEDIARLDIRARIVHFVRNYGQTAALTAGIRMARADLLVTLDADLQNDPSDIPMMLTHLDDADVVCGWRKDRQDSYLSRTFPSKIANWLISRLSNVYMHDYGCTLRIYRKEFIQDIPLYGEMHRFIPIYVTWAGARLVEVPVKHHPRTQGESKYGLWRIPKVLLDLTTLKFLRDFFVTPIYFFWMVGNWVCWTRVVVYDDKYWIVVARSTSKSRQFVNNVGSDFIWTGPGGNHIGYHRRSSHSYALRTSTKRTVSHCQTE